VSLRTSFVILCLCAAVLGQPCHAENDGPTYNDGVSMGGPNLLLGVKFTSPANIVVTRVEVFTGEGAGMNSAGIWSHDSAGNQPAVDLGTGIWSMSTSNSWQGGNLSGAVSLVSGTTYWMVWGPQNGSQCSVDQPGATPVQQYRGSFSGGASWNGPFQFSDRPWKFRLVCGSGPAVYQTNQLPCAYLDIGGVLASGYAPAVTTGSPPLGSWFATVAGNTYPWDVVWSVNAGLIPAYWTSPGGQIVNVDLGQASFIFGASFTNALSMLAVPIGLPPGATSFEAQLVVIDPTQADGFCLSQAVMLN